MNMQDWARAFPRLRHDRVMKPRSAGNSPSAATRRRTATTTQSMMHGASHQYQSSLQAALLASAVGNPRPISWHPSSARSRGLSNPACMPDFPAQDYATMNNMSDPSLNMNNNLPVYSNENMYSYPMFASASDSPENYLPYYMDSQEMTLPQQTPMLSIPSSQVEPMAWDTTPVDMSAVSQTTSDGWPLDMLSMANIPPPETTCPSYASVPSPGELSGPSTPDFLPIQHFDSPLPQEKKGKAEEELVGMGLYSQPDGIMSHSQQGLLGKGLKLEETFSPSDDEKDDDDDDEPEPVPQVPEQPAPTMQQPNMVPKHPMKPAMNLLHKSFFFDQEDLDQQAMTAAQSFSLNQPCMSYGYSWI